MQTWRNGEKAEVVHNIIKQNFNILERYLPNSILALSTDRRLLLSSEYLRSGLVVFDTDLQKWLKYNGQTWEDYVFPYTGYAKAISVSDWSSEKNIIIPFSEHLTPNPAVHLYILHNNTYEPVDGGYIIDINYNITLTSDLLFDGKVVVK